MTITNRSRFKYALQALTSIRNIVKAIEYSYLYGNYNAKLQQLEETTGDSTNAQEHSSYIHAAYNIVTSINLIRAASLMSFIWAGRDLTFNSVANDKEKVIALSLHTIGLAFDYLHPEKLLTYKTGTIIHYMPEFIILPIVKTCHIAVSLNSYDVKEVAKVSQHILTGLAPMLPLLLFKITEHSYNEQLKIEYSEESIKPNPHAIEEAGISDTLKDEL